MRAAEAPRDRARSGSERRFSPPLHQMEPAGLRVRARPGGAMAWPWRPLVRARADPARSAAPDGRFIPFRARIEASPGAGARTACRGAAAWRSSAYKWGRGAGPVELRPG
jgi:hypothetical protein